MTWKFLEIDADEAQLGQIVAQLQGHEREFPKILAAALNDAIRETKTKLVRMITDEVTIKKKDLDNERHLQISDADQYSLTGALILNKTRRLSVSYFGARELGHRGIRTIAGRRFRVGKGGGGLTYKIKRDAGRAFIPGGFLVPKASLRHNPPDAEGEIAFKRGKEGKRLPIIKLHGPSAWGVYLKARLGPNVHKVGAESLSKHARRRVNLFLMRQRGAT